MARGAPDHDSSKDVKRVTSPTSRLCLMGNIKRPTRRGLHYVPPPRVTGKPCLLPWFIPLRNSVGDPSETLQPCYLHVTSVASFFNPALLITMRSMGQQIGW
eukprot:396413-Amphidinium_carterae.1